MGMLHDALHPKGRYDVGIEKVSYLDCSLASGTETPRPLYVLIFLWPILANLFYKSSVLIVYDRSGSIAPSALKPLRRCLRGPEMSMHPAEPTHAIMIDQRASDL